MIIDINRSLKLNKYYAGTRLKCLPTGAKHLRRCPIYRLNSRTLQCLKQFEIYYGVYWYDYQIYDVKNRTGYIIYGQLDYQIEKNKYITYLRRETPSICAGQTWIYILNGLRIQKTILLDNFNPTFKNYKHNIKQWIELVKQFKCGEERWNYMK